MKVIRSAGAVGAFILLSRMFGLIRDMSMAAAFGTTLSMSAFVVAFTIPNLFRSLFGEGAMSSAFVPIFTETREREGNVRVWTFASRMFSALSFILLTIVLSGMLFITVLLRVFPDNELIVLILGLLRIMLPYMFLICVAAFFSSMLNALHNFMLPAIVPVVLNVVVIATLLWVCPRLEAEGYSRIKAVAWAVIVGGVIQAIMQLPRLFKQGFMPRISFNWGDAGVMRVWHLMGVATIGVGITRINVLFDRFIAAFIGSESPSYLYFSERLIYFPLGIFATALGTVLLPVFSGHAAQARKDRIAETLNRSVRHLMFVMLPAAAGMMALARPIVRMVYERGDFTLLSTEMTMLALMCYSPGLIMFGLLKLLVPVFYAQQDMKTPMRVGMVCTVLNISLSLVLMWPFKHLGIALATVLSSTVNVVFLFIFAQRKIGALDWRRIIISVFKMICATAVMTIATIMSHNWLYETTGYMRLWLSQGIALFSSIGLAIFIYGAAALIFRCSELGEIWNAVKGRE